MGVGGGSAPNAVFAIEEIVGLGDLRRRIAIVSSSCSWSTWDERSPVSWRMEET